MVDILLTTVFDVARPHDMVGRDSGQTFRLQLDRTDVPCDPAQWRARLLQATDYVLYVVAALVGHHVRLSARCRKFQALWIWQ